MKKMCACVILALLTSTGIARAQKAIVVRPVEYSSLRVTEDPSAGVYRALLIGIDRFADGKIRPLRFCRADASALRSLLKDPNHLPVPNLDLNTLLDEEATTNGVRSGLERLAADALPEDTVLIYFSSHGIRNADGEGYWILHDTQVDLRAYQQNELEILSDSALSQKEISGLINRIRARRLILFVDCCFSSATVISYPRGESFHHREVKDAFREFGGTGRIVITASEGNQLSVELTALGHGAFTYFLMEGLKGGADGNRDNVVEVWEIWEYLEDKVAEAAERLNQHQRPTISTLALTHGFPLSTYPLVESSNVEMPTDPSSQPDWVKIAPTNGPVFCISATETTNREFLDFVQANPQWRKDRIPTAFHDGDYLKHWPAPDRFPPSADRHPVTYVSWFAAKAYADWRGGSLPTEFQWTTAAIGDVAGSRVVASGSHNSPPSFKNYPWGARWEPGRCNNEETLRPVRGIPGTPVVEVDTFPRGASSWGGKKIYNLSGNVWEWCDNWSYEQNAVNSPAALSRIPDGMYSSSLNRLIKGGSFLAGNVGCMISSQVWSDPRLCAEDGGFRVVRRR